MNSNFKAWIKPIRSIVQTMCKTNQKRTLTNLHNRHKRFGTRDGNHGSRTTPLPSHMCPEMDVWFEVKSTKPLTMY